MLAAATAQRNTSRAAAALALAARPTAKGAPRGLAFSFLSLGVFAVALFFGSGSLSVVFSVSSVAPSFRRVVWRCSSRSVAARLLWRFRALRRAWRSFPRLGSRAWVRAGLSLPRPGSLAWLAALSVVVCVRGAGVGGRRRSAFVVAVPAGRFVRG